MGIDTRHPLLRGFSYPVHAMLWSHALLSLAFWIAQPGGFAFGSASFIEHQVLVPAYFAVAAWVATGALFFPRRILPAVGLIAGSWLAGGLVLLRVGATPHAAAAGVVLASGLGVIALILKNIRRGGDSIVGVWPGLAIGILTGIGFAACAWAPPATTRPLPAAPAAPQPRFVPEKSPPFRITIDARDARISIATEGRRVEVWPLMNFSAVAESGFWTVFETRRIRGGPWTGSRNEQGALILISGQDEFDSETRVWSEGGRAHVRTVTTLKRDIAAHLASSFRILAPGTARLEEGVLWEKGTGRDVAEFFAFRGGKLEFLRASSREKGPFETLVSREPHDPRLSVGGWDIQVVGWAEQASREESPTAGWGVSQGSIEKVGEEYVWSLATTSIGRGWHSVRTGRGTYVLEAVISRANR